MHRTAHGKRVPRPVSTLLEILDSCPEVCRRSAERATVSTLLEILGHGRTADICVGVARFNPS